MNGGAAAVLYNQHATFVRNCHVHEYESCRPRRQHVSCATKVRPIRIGALRNSVSSYPTLTMVAAQREACCNQYSENDSLYILMFSLKLRNFLEGKLSSCGWMSRKDNFNAADCVKNPPTLSTEENKARIVQFSSSGLYMRLLATKCARLVTFARVNKDGNSLLEVNAT